MEDCISLRELIDELIDLDSTPEERDTASALANFDSAEDALATELTGEEFSHVRAALHRLQRRGMFIPRTAVNRFFL